MRAASFLILNSAFLIHPALRPAVEIGRLLPHPRPASTTEPANAPKYPGRATSRNYWKDASSRRAYLAPLAPSAPFPLAPPPSQFLSACHQNPWPPWPTSDPRTTAMLLSDHMERQDRVSIIIGCLLGQIFRTRNPKSQDSAPGRYQPAIRRCTILDAHGLKPVNHTLGSRFRATRRRRSIAESLPPARRRLFHAPIQSRDARGPLHASPAAPWPRTAAARARCARPPRACREPMERGRIQRAASGRHPSSVQLSRMSRLPPPPNG
jgi:hypothetical protein